MLASQIKHLVFNFPHTVDGTDRLCVSERAQCIPCRVLHLRHLPADVSEQEVLALALPFGRVSKLITLKTKNQVSSEPTGERFPLFTSQRVGGCHSSLLHAGWAAGFQCALLGLFDHLMIQGLDGNFFFRVF